MLAYSAVHIMMWQGMGVSCIMYKIREFLGHNFVSGLRTLISKN